MAHSIKAACKNKNDELYTPKILVEAIQPYLDNCYQKLKKKFKRDPIIWLPFDKENSEFVYLCKKHHYKYVFSHKDIDNGDFFKYEPKQWDLAVSNPPFSKKLDVFKRLNKLDKPWAMIMNIMALNYQCIGNYFVDNPCQMLIVDKRISFNGHTSSFNSSYICGKGFLGKNDLIFKHIANNNTNKFFKPSRMMCQTKTKLISKTKCQKKKSGSYYKQNYYQNNSIFGEKNV